MTGEGRSLFFFNLKRCHRIFIPFYLPFFVLFLKKGCPTLKKGKKAKPGTFHPGGALPKENHSLLFRFSSATFPPRQRGRRRRRPLLIKIIIIKRNLASEGRFIARGLGRTGCAHAGKRVVGPQPPPPK